LPPPNLRLLFFLTIVGFLLLMLGLIVLLLIIINFITNNNQNKPIFVSHIPNIAFLGIVSIIFIGICFKNITGIRIADCSASWTDTVVWNLETDSVR
jgi:hypothetical protein